MKSLIPILLLLTLGGCQTTKDSVLLGSGIGGLLGASAGAALGSSTGNETKGALIGLGAGAAIGGLAGYEKSIKKGNGQSQSLSPLNTDGDSRVPTLTMPEVKRIWKPDQIVDDQYIPGHYIYVLSKQSRWRMKNDRDTGGKRNDKR
jgi:hypothetical protein